MSIKIKTISVGCNRRDESSSGNCDPVDHAPNFPKLNRYAIPYALCSVAIAFCKIRSCYSYVGVLPCFSRVLYAYGQKRFQWFVEFRLDSLESLFQRLLESSRENRNIESSTVRSRVAGKRFGRPLRKTASCETSLLCYSVRLFVRSSIKIARYLSCKNYRKPLENRGNCSRLPLDRELLLRSIRRGSLTKSKRSKTSRWFCERGPSLGSERDDSQLVRPFSPVPRSTPTTYRFFHKRHFVQNILYLRTSRNSFLDRWCFKHENYLEYFIDHSPSLVFVSFFFSLRFAVSKHSRVFVPNPPSNHERS